MLTVEQELLFNQNMKLAYLFANNWIRKINFIEYDDLVSLCLVGLFKAAKSFNPDKGVKFSGYATFVTDNEIKLHMRHTRRHRDQLSLDEPLSNDDGDTITRLELIPLQDNAFHSVLLNEAMDEINKLKPRDRYLFIEVKIKGRGQKDVSKETGISQAHISRILRRIQKRLVSKLKEEEYHSPSR